MIPHETLDLFSPLWWQSNFVTLTAVFCFLILGKLGNSEIREKLAMFIATILLIRAIGVHFYWNSVGIWTIEFSLPLHLCGLSAILSGLVLFWQKQWVYECLYFWGLPGAFHSLLTPEFTMGTEGLIFYDYYLSHGGIILSALYLTIILGMKPRKGSWWRIFIRSQILLPIIGFINWGLDANYMYLCIKPIAKNPLLFWDWPWYILGLEIVGLLHFIIIYLPFGFIYRKTENKIRTVF